jgi:hypothetical protein
MKFSALAMLAVAARAVKLSQDKESFEVTNVDYFYEMYDMCFVVEFDAPATDVAVSSYVVTFMGPSINVALECEHSPCKFAHDAIAEAGVRIESVQVRPVFDANLEVPVPVFHS